MSFVIELHSLSVEPKGTSHLPGSQKLRCLTFFFNLQKKERNENKNKNMNSRDMIILRLTRKKIQNYSL